MIAYRGTLDVPRELVWFAAKLLAASGADAAPAGQQGAALPLAERVLDPVQVRADRADADE